MHSFFLITLGLSLGAVIALGLSKTAQRRVLVGLGVAFAVIVIPPLWKNSTEWRVRNVPAFTTTSEREWVAVLDELKKTRHQLQETYQSNEY